MLIIPEIDIISITISGLKIRIIELRFVDLLNEMPSHLSVHSLFDAFYVCLGFG
jgi:hypothetical protein